MKKRTKGIALIFAAVVLLVFCALFAGCTEKATLKFMTFDGDYVEIEGKVGEAAEFPSVNREGYALAGWYEEESCDGIAVTEAVFQKGKTYYAKWSKTYAVTFDLDGGAMSSGAVYLAEGQEILGAVSGSVPTKGDLRFGGWYLGDQPLEAADKMPAGGVTLTARYMAKYTINVYLQELNLEDYAFEAQFASGYALVGEEFFPDLKVDGFTLLEDGDDSVFISENSADNVINLKFDRNSYTLWFLSNYPEGSGQSQEELSFTYLYGEELSFPDSVPFRTDGYRFFGWGTYADARFDETVSPSELKLDGDVVLHAIWNKGYVDMFAGEDTIFLMRDGTGKAVLCRGGKDIEGSYNEKKDWYEFESPTTSFVLRARVNDNGTFVFYANRKGEYFLFDSNGIDKEATLALDDMNGVELYRTSEGNKQYLEGEYSIDENGYYEAVFSDGTRFVFLLGTAADPQSGVRLSVFRIRGEEADWGVLPYKAVYYPAITLDGFGYALFEQQPGRTAYVGYVIDGDVFTLYDTTSGSVVLTAKAGSYKGVWGWEQYDAQFDKVFENGSATLTLDGCSTAIYMNDGQSFVGSYTVESSLVEGYIITVVSSSGEKRVFVAFEKLGSTDTAFAFEEKHADYGEYLFVTDDGKLAGYPFLVVNGDGTAATYERGGQGTPEKTSSGVISKQGDFYLYTVTGQIADWAVNRFAALVLNFDTQSTSYDVYYVISLDDGEASTDFSTVYTGENGARLTIVSCFAVFDDGSGSVLSGVFSQGPDFIRLNDGNADYYFRLDQDGKTFVRLAYEPAVLVMKRNGSTVSSSTLTVSGNKYGEDGYEAVFTEKAGGVSTSCSGYYTYEELESVGAKFAVYTFHSQEKNFKFIVSASTSTIYFHYFELYEVITFGSYSGLDDSDGQLAESKLSLTDEKDAAGNLFVVYIADGNSTKGTFTSGKTSAFGRFEQTVYTFTAAEGDLTFDFTLINSYFRICAPDASFAAADGSVLQLDGKTHMARYFDTQNEYFSYYVVTNNVLDQDETAIAMLINDVERRFDLNGSDGTFALRGLEEGAYLKVKNNMPDGEIIIFDGHGNATLKKADGGEIKAEYAFADGLCTISFEGGSYVGETGLFAADGNQYYAFLFFGEGVAGAYLDCDDLSVVELDGFGNATRYNYDGHAERGRYTLLSDTIFYFESQTGSDALYKFASGGKVIKSDFAATYYAEDFASVVFYINGVVLFNNSNAIYFSYDESAQKIYTYTPSDSEDANSYGFVVEEFSEDGGSITYTDPQSGITRRYDRFDGKYMTLEDGNGGTLEFQPDGRAEFTVSAVYTDSAGKQSQFYFVVYYDGNNEVVTMLARFATGALKGSASDFLFKVNYFIDVDLAEKAFALDAEKYIYGLTAYDYTYVQLITVYGSGWAFLFEEAYGYLNITADVVDGRTTFSVSGRFNFIKDALGNALAFSGGTLSSAGYIDSRVESFGNMFSSEVVAADGNTYHINFYLAYDGNLQEYVYIIYSCTMVEEKIELDGGSVVYKEVFLYSSGFRFVKGQDEETGEPIYFSNGDAFYPTLKYRGETVVVHNFMTDGENRWIFFSRVYSGKSYTDYRYYFDFTLDDDGNIMAGELVRMTEKTYRSALGDAAHVVCDEETGEITDISGLTVDGEYKNALSCTDNGDDTFTVVTSDGTYTVTIHRTTDGRIERVSISLIGG